MCKAHSRVTTTHVFLESPFLSRLESHLEKFGEVAQRVYLLDQKNGHRVDDLMLKVQALEIQTQGMKVGWGRIVGTAWQLAITLVTAFLVWKLGWRG